MKKTVIKLSIFFLTISLGYSQGVINSEKLFNSEVEKFYFILSPTIDIQSGNSEVFETGVQFSSLYKITQRNWLKGTAGVDIIREEGEDVSNDKFLQLRHTFSIKKWIHTFTFYQLQNSFSLGVKKRELLGSGNLMGYQVIPDFIYEMGYENNGLMLLSPMALITVGIIIWIQRSRNTDLIEQR